MIGCAACTILALILVVGGLKLASDVWTRPPGQAGIWASSDAPGQENARLSNVLPPWQIRAAPVADQDTRSEAQPTVTARGAAVVLQGASLNGVAIDKIIVMPPATRQRVRQIFAAGQTIGRNPRAFSKIGDSTMLWPPFLAVFDTATSYRLGSYAYLQPTIEYFAGSFARSSLAVGKGMHTWTEFEPTWADHGQCRPGEGPLQCELRLHNPSVAFIRLGTNDAYEPAAFEASLRRIVDTCIEGGVIPVLGTKPDRVEGVGNTINEIVYKLAATYSIPLWDYDIIAATVPGKGLQGDGIHYVGGGTHDYTSPAASWGADSLQDLTALIMLDTITRVVQQADEGF